MKNFPYPCIASLSFVLTAFSSSAMFASSMANAAPATARVAATATGSPAKPEPVVLGEYAIKPEATGALVTIDQVIQNMSAKSEAIPIDPRYDWCYQPSITMHAPRGDAIPSWWTGNRPEWTYDVLSWFVAMEAQGNKATNTRVQVANLRMYILSESTRKWTRVDIATAPDVELWTYPFDPVGGDGGKRIESSGGISVKPKYPNFHHGYGHGKSITPWDVRATFVAMDFRLVRDNPYKPDDRAYAKYVINTGGDYWPGKGIDWSLGYAPGMAAGRMMLATPSWRAATMLVPNKNYGSTFEDLRNNPPPLL